MTKAEVAEVLGVSPRTVDRLRAQGLLPTARVLGAVRFRPADVRAVLGTKGS
jgi:excisionase family DNA binding protein